MENNIKIVRFKDNLDVVCFMEELENNKFSITDPLIFEIRNSNLVMQHWLPVAMIKENKTVVNGSDILCVMDPEDEFLEYYMTTVEKLNQSKLPKTKSKDEEKELLIGIMEALNEMDNTKNLILH